MKNHIATEYIAPLSLWLVIRKRFQSGGLFIEPAWTGAYNRDERGPVIFVSRMHAEIYAYMRNTYHAEDDSDNWKTISLQDFDLLNHATDLGGEINCMMAFGFSLTEKEEIIVVAGAPRIRYVPLPFRISKNQKIVVFSFNQWVFDFIEKEWTKIGISNFENYSELSDNLTVKELALSVKIAIAKTPVSHEVSTVTTLWGVYSSQDELWKSGGIDANLDKTIH